MADLRVIKVFEDRQIKLKLTDEEEKDILSIRNIIGENNLSLQADGKLLISHYVGFIQVNNTRLLIYPKISNRAIDDSTYDKSFQILIKLLSYSKYNTIKRIPSPQNIGRYEGDLLEVFISIFIEELLNLFRKDVNRNYNQHSENQSFIKGKIDFTETIKKNSYRKHLHYVKYENFTTDIVLNQIFKSIIKNLIIKTKIKENKLKLKQGLLWLEDVEDISINNEIWHKVKFTRLNNNYKPLFNMAKLFYYNSSPNLNKGDEFTFSFLVPLNKLFEYYLYKILYNNASNNLKVNYQGPVNYLAKKENKRFMKLEPDIILTEEENIKYILDAKYKEIVDIKDNINLLQADIYQMLAYGVRYECNNIALVYPKFLEDKDESIEISDILIKNKEEEICIKLLKINLEDDPEITSKKLMELFKIDI